MHIDILRNELIYKQAHALATNAKVKAWIFIGVVHTAHRPCVQVLLFMCRNDMPPVKYLTPVELMYLHLFL